MLFNRKDIRGELEKEGFKNLGNIFWNAPTPILYEEAIRRREGHLAHLGPLVVRTGHHVGRSPKDRFIVREPSSMEKVWWGDVNIGIEEDRFNNLLYRLQAYLQTKDIFVQDCYAGADPKYRIPVRVITETAWHNLFARNMFIQMKSEDEIETHKPKFTVIQSPRFHALPEVDGTTSEAFILLHLGRNLVLIGGTSYAGEIKKSIFTMLNYVYPQEEVLSMHCSVNMSEDGEDVAVFFGLSGTGKTTLSSTPDRILIGDDEHGWSENGVFNFEGGCYAKVIRLSKEDEPEIYECTRKFGTILENVSMDLISRRLDLNDDSLTENTRAAYPISHLPNATRKGMCGHPKNVIMLTYDAFGVMPPVARLSIGQAVFHFLSGYTAKVAGTEIGVKEPQATFSACFGAPFMALPPSVYARLFMEKIKRHRVQCWLINTGTIGDPYGKTKRISIEFTRKIVRAVLNNGFEGIGFKDDPIFGFQIPEGCDGIDSNILDPRRCTTDLEDYEKRAKRLAKNFISNFKAYEKEVSEEVLVAKPRL